jgi:hypothetical protein
MAGRLPMPIGTHGKITTVELTPPGTKRGEMIWEARTRFRDADGASRRVKRTGRSKNAAETNLKAALLERQHNAAVDLTGASRLSEAAARWLWLAARRADVSTGDLGPRSVDEYAPRGHHRSLRGVDAGPAQAQGPEHLPEVTLGAVRDPRLRRPDGRHHRQPHPGHLPRAVRAQAQAPLDDGGRADRVAGVDWTPMSPRSRCASASRRAGR